MRYATLRRRTFAVRRPRIFKVAVNTPAYFEDYARNEEEAINRARTWREDDPFEGQIERSLLSSNEIALYVKQTAMLFPFNQDDLKTASYAVKFGEFAYEFDDDGGYRRTRLSDCSGGLLKLPANSIVFVQCATHFRLPKYMALRFNLRIKHVHRGLLLGTGPLIDPGFEGELLIPVHNLTSKDHYVDVDSHVIWIEFTKTTYKKPSAPQKPDLARFDKRKQNVAPEFYLDDARKSLVNGSYLPIQSSINGIMRESIDVARKANDVALNTEKKLFDFQLYSAVGAALAVLGIFFAVNFFIGQFVQATYEQVDEARQISSAALASQGDRIGELEARVGDNPSLNQAVTAAFAEFREENAALREELETLSSALKEALSTKGIPAANSTVLPIAE